AKPAGGDLHDVDVGDGPSVRHHARRSRPRSSDQRGVRSRSVSSSETSPTRSPDGPFPGSPAVSQQLRNLVTTSSHVMGLLTCPRSYSTSRECSAPVSSRPV